MYTLFTKATRLVSGLAASLLLMTAAHAAAPVVVPLTAQLSQTTLPDGTTVPMWGYACGSIEVGSPCAYLNGGNGGNWSPVVITVPYTGSGTSLTIQLSNTLSFSGNNIPTSMVIVGQIGGGLGAGGTTAASPAHAPQGATWPIITTPPPAGGIGASNPGALNTPVAQLPRVQSFGTEVAAGQTVNLTWNNLRPGTYLIESGTHPSIQVPMGLYGILVVTTQGTLPAGQAYSAATTQYDADVPMLLSEIDAVQNNAVNAAVNTTGFSETAVWSGQSVDSNGNTLNGCADASVGACYPPAVNYAPTYFLVNGVSFDRSNIAASTAQVLAPVGTSVAAGTGNVLVRLVNAGSRMHVPSLVGMPFTLVAEDGNPLPGQPRNQNEVFLSPGKTYDVMIKPAQAGGNYTPSTYAFFDRQGSVTTNNNRDGGMQAYLAIAGGAATGVGSSASQRGVAGLTNKTYYCQIGQTLSVLDPVRGLLAGSSGATGIVVQPYTTVTPTNPALPGGVVTINANGTFTYQAPVDANFQPVACGGTTTFTAVNDGTPHTLTFVECDATTQDPGCSLGGKPVLGNDNYTATNAQRIIVNKPGVLGNDVDPAGLVLSVVGSSVTPSGSLSAGNIQMNPDGSFVLTNPTPGVAGTYTFTYLAQNTQQSIAASPATVTVMFPAATGLQVHVVDQKHPDWAITDYRWIIEEDKTFWHDPKCQVNTGSGTRPMDSYGRPCPPLPVEAVGYNFATSNSPVVATGCTGPVSCEAGQTAGGNGVPALQALTPDQVALDPNKHYFISVMPADGINPTIAGVGGPVVDNATGKKRQFDPSLDCPNQTDFVTPGGKCGHNMGGAQIPPQFMSDGTRITNPSVTVPLIETPLPTAKIAVLVYEDDYPLNGENDAGGGVDILAPNEPGLAGFQIVLIDQAGQLGDNVGQITYDMFNMPVSNALAGTIDPMTGNNACPLTSNPDGIVGMIVTCPKYESDGKTLSPLAGQATIENLYPGLYEVQAFAGAERMARGEEWLQTNTLDGGKPHEAFIRPGEPAYFQEFGPGGFHVQIGFANPKIINDRRHNTAGTGLCDPAPKGGGLTCNSTIVGQVHGNHMSRTPDERTYDTGSYDAFAFSACYVSIGIPDEQDIAFTKCDGEGNFTVTGMPDGVYKVAVFDQWNDIMLDGLVTSLTVNGQTNFTVTATQWRTNLYTRTYLDTNNNGIPDRDASGNDLEAGLGLVPMNIRYRTGAVAFKNTTDLNGYAAFNEVFPLMAWLVVEPDTTRYKSTGVHVIYDAGGPDDCSAAAIAMYGAQAHCSKSASHLAGTMEFNPLPTELRIPGAVYCLDADCAQTQGNNGILNGYYYNTTNPSSGPVANLLSSGRIDPPNAAEGWQGLLGQHNFIDFGLKPYLPTENGGIGGMVVYASTRPFDDPTLLVENQWEPGVPRVRVNLYKQGVAADGEPTLTLVDSTTTDSFDDFAQGFRTDGSGNPQHLLVTDGNGHVTTNGAVNAGDSSGYIPNMNCPGQDPTSGFFATLQGSKMWLDTPDQNGNKKQLAYKSQFKCFDGWSMLNQIAPATYDGKYQFPSVVDRDPTTGHPSKTNCSICTANPDDGNPMLPPGKYVVEVVTPEGYEVVKEEDKNILMGDVFIAPLVQQFNGLGNVFILPDQAAMNAYYNPSNAVNSTTNLGVQQLPKSTFAMTNDQIWACVGESHTVPDNLSLFPGVGLTAPFAGASRPLCDRKEIILGNQMQAHAKFFLFTKAHKAGMFYGVMSNDMASEFDPFSPAFGEKFGPPNLPVRMRNFVGDEVTRVYADQWGVYNGLFVSSWEVNPPNPAGYAPQMAIACMNDPGPILDQTVGSPTFGQMITDPQYNPAYSNFCYEQPFMPGVTTYQDTPVTPVQAFADHYNLPDAEYPDATPVIKRADFLPNKGPWSATSASVTSIAVGQRGSGYTQAPTVQIGGAGGAAASATMRVDSITLGNAAGYTGYTSAPTVTLTGNGIGASASACLGVISAQIGNQGTGYGAAQPSVTFTGGTVVGAARAAARLTVTAGKITGISVQSAGCYTSPPTGITINRNATKGTSADATATIISTGLVSVTVNNAGSGYTSAPTVGFSTGTASATATLSLDAITLTSGGSGYSATPSVTLSGGGSSGATATATLGGYTATNTLTLTAFGDRSVQNPQYAGPSASIAPYNQKVITRHYGFGSQCTAPSPTCETISSVTIGGLAATINSWTDSTINVTVPAGLPPCTVQQIGAPSTAYCGEVVVTAGNGKQTIDGITVTLGGKTPTVVTPSSATSTVFGENFANPLQTAIDQAAPGDLIIVDAGSYRENLIMWKPVRLQGVGAGSVTINADAHPAGKMDSWRRRVDCLFGLTLQGAQNVGNSIFDPASKYTCPGSQYFKNDRLPFEGFVGWDASSNGNLAQVLQEPSLMGAYEGAGITVLGRGINQDASNWSDPWGQAAGAGAFADGSKYLGTNSTGSSLLANPQAGAECDPTRTPTSPMGDYYTANFNCNPSSIDGLSIMNSSQGGGGIYMHGWSHNLQVANNRLSANAGTLSGAINLGNGEVPPTWTLDNVICGDTGANPAPLCPPVPAGTKIGGAIPHGFQRNVRVHHNQIINNASIGDALFSGTPAGAGGISIAAGSDDYEVDHNWIAANLTSSDGGGIAHMGLSYRGKIHNNFVLFNESNNPTLPVDGGGIIVMGAQEDRTLPNGQECGGSTDNDCPPGMGGGTGPGLVIDSNLILGNSALYGSGGGLRLRQTNGTEVAAFPASPSDWYDITVTNNIIVNNVAGWDGAGVSLQDSFKTVIANNTIASNDTTASAGVLFKTLGAIMASSPPPGCIPTPNPDFPQNPNCLGTNAPHMPQPAGLVTMQNTPNMMAQFAGVSVVCPAGFGYGDSTDSTASRTNGRCLLASLPYVVNDLFWQNRAFHVEIVDQNGNPISENTAAVAAGNGLGAGVYSHQNIVSLLPHLQQTTTGQCVAPPANQELYWDVGVRMDTWGNNGHTLNFNATTVGAAYTLGATLQGVLGSPGTGAIATAALRTTGTVAQKKTIASIAVTQAGSGYTTQPVVTIAAPSCTINTTTCIQATAVAYINASGGVASISITNAGAGYTSASPPTVTIVGNNPGTVASVTILDGGAGYTQVPTIAVDPPSCTVNGTTCVQAVVSATLDSNGAINKVTVTNAGAGYTSVPNVAITDSASINPNGSDSGPIVVQATHSIFTDAVNAGFATPNGTLVPAQANVIPTSAPVLGQYCNGARIPPEICTQSQLGVNHPGMCMGYNAPAGQSETAGVSQAFLFNGIQASATVDEGNNWINMTYGPLTLSRPNGAPSAEGIVASPSVASYSGVYTINSDSAAVDAGADVSAYTTHDFFGNPRKVNTATDIGAMEYTPPQTDVAVTKTASATSINEGDSLTYTIRVTNTLWPVTGATVTDTAPAGVTFTSWTCAATLSGDACPASGSGNLSAQVNLAAGGSVVFTVNATTAPGVAHSMANTATVAMPRSVADTNTANNSSTATVTVAIPAPVLSSATILPGGGFPGANAGSPNAVTFTITGGNHLTGASAISASGTGVTCNNITNVSETSLTATCSIAYNAATGQRQLTVTTPGGTAQIPFSVYVPVSLTTSGVQTVLGYTGFGYTGNNALCIGTNALCGTAKVLGSSTAQTFTYSNPAGNAPATVTSVAVTPAYATEFTVSSDTCTGHTVQAGSTCTFVLSFTPTKAETIYGAAATITVTATGYNAPFVYLEGNAAASDTLQAATGSSATFSSTTKTASSTTSSGSAASANVTASGTLTGTFAAGMSITGTNIPANTTITTVAGFGTTRTLTLSNKPTGTVSGALSASLAPQLTQTFTFTNNNAAAFVLSQAPSLSGTGASHYAVTGGTCANATSVAAGGTCSVVVTFTAATPASAQTATLTVTGAVGSTTGLTATVSLTGT